MNSVSQPAAQPDLVRVDCCNGKYTVIHSGVTGLRALRYGEEWRDCLGDGLILALASDLEEARTQNATLQTRIDQLEAARRIDTLTTAHYVANVANVALAQLWKMLGADNQTEAVLALRELPAKPCKHFPEADDLCVVCNPHKQEAFRR